MFVLFTMLRFYLLRCLVLLVLLFPTYFICSQEAKCREKTLISPRRMGFHTEHMVLQELGSAVRQRSRLERSSTKRKTFPNWFLKPSWKMMFLFSTSSDWGQRGGSKRKHERNSISSSYGWMGEETFASAISSLFSPLPHTFVAYGKNLCKSDKLKKMKKFITCFRLGTFAPFSQICLSDSAVVNTIVNSEIFRISNLFYAKNVILYKIFLATCKICGC